MPRKYPIDTAGLETIKELGYTVTQFSPYHFRISKPESDLALDVFPTSRRYCRRKGDHMSQGKPYENIVHLVEDQLDTYGARFKGKLLEGKERS